MISSKQKKYEIFYNPILIISLIIFEYYLINRTFNIVSYSVYFYINYCFFKSRIIKGILILLNLLSSKIIAYYLHFVFPDIWIISLTIIFLKIIDFLNFKKRLFSSII